MIMETQHHQSIFVQGAVDRYDCIYVKPQTGRSNYKFDIMYNSCGSKPDLNGRFYENNIVVQYDQDLIEVHIYSHVLSSVQLAWWEYFS